MGAFDSLRGDQLQEGWLGKHTSTIDWCELNYSHTPYIAEFVNTLTNLPSILLGLYGARRIIAQGVPKRYALCYLGLTLIGLGSFGFHMSLRWEWQLMDELPMIYLITYAAYLSLDTRTDFRPRFGVWGPLAVLAADVFITVSYISLPNPVYHQIIFAATMITCLARSFILIRRLPPDHGSRSRILRTILWGMATFALGFAVWNVDNVFCDTLRSARSHMGPWGFLLEGHGWWHILTGYGGFLIFTATIYLQLCIKVNPDAYVMPADSWFPVPLPAVPKDVADVKAGGPEKLANGSSVTSNGSAKSKRTPAGKAGKTRLSNGTNGTNGTNGVAH